MSSSKPSATTTSLVKVVKPDFKPDFSRLLPQNKKVFKYVDLGKLHVQQNPRLNTSSIDGQLKLLDIATGHDPSVGTYGGFLEDRTELWRVEYPPVAGRPTWHLGLDINNLEAGEAVCSLTYGVVVDVFVDNADVKSNGWGGRIIIMSGGQFVLYGHLSHESIVSADMKVGTAVKRGQVIGKVGSTDVNGHWFAHLHIQCMTRSFIQERYEGKYDQIDGYIQEKDASALALELIDPLSLLS